jgi:hypothetical protein
METVGLSADEESISEAAFKHWRQALPGDLVEASDEDGFNKSLLSVGLFNPAYWVESLEINSAIAEPEYQSFTTVLNEITAVARDQGESQAWAEAQLQTGWTLECLGTLHSGRSHSGVDRQEYCIPGIARCRCR